MAVRLSALRAGHSAAGRTKVNRKKSDDVIGNGTHHLPACSIVPEGTTLAAYVCFILHCGAQSVVITWPTLLFPGDSVFSLSVEP
jgi:hypothetical protein